MRESSTKPPWRSRWRGIISRCILLFSSKLLDLRSLAWDVSASPTEPEKLLSEELVFLWYISSCNNGVFPASPALTARELQEELMIVELLRCTNLLGGGATGFWSKFKSSASFPNSRSDFALKSVGSRSVALVAVLPTRVAVDLGTDLVSCCSCRRWGWRARVILLVNVDIASSDDLKTMSRSCRE